MDSEGVKTNSSMDDIINHIPSAGTWYPEVFNCCATVRGPLKETRARETLGINVFVLSVIFCLTGQYSHWVNIILSLTQMQYTLFPIWKQALFLVLFNITTG